MNRTALEERENILKIMHDEMENQPMASQKTRDTYSALHDAAEAYVNATQEDAFYWGYMTAMKQYEKTGVVE
jgi:hypothetical protein